jgi:YidC/Oxa1 family membrane protein insertase
MALSIFLQQKFQPSTTADPNQKKIMMLMPFIFGFIMLNVSSGLVLYIFVSTLFGIIQQYFVYRTTD